MPSGFGHRTVMAGALVCTVVLLSSSACGTGSHDDRPPSVIRVPADAPTPQAALDRAHEGDLILLAPGRYTQTVKVNTPGVALRGADRNTVVVDGEGKRANGIVVTAPGVTVENLTIASHLVNGLLVTGQTNAGDGVAHGSSGYQPLDTNRFPPMQGYRIRHVTAYNNGLYGIYVFDAQNGEISDNHASGSADSGIYLGQCKPCRALVARNVAEHNAVGYEAANASVDTYVAGNRFTNNRVGMTILSDYQEALVPQQSSTVVGNLLSDNNEPVSPAQADGAYGLGLGIAGGQHNTIVRNRIERNSSSGITIASSSDIPPVGNRFDANAFDRNTVDVSYTASPSAAGHDNCVTNSTPNRTVPGDALTRMCSSQPTPGAPTMPPNAPAGMPFLQIPRPRPQSTLERPDALPAGRAWWDPAGFDVAAYPLPANDYLANYIGHS